MKTTHGLNRLRTFVTVKRVINQTIEVVSIMAGDHAVINGINDIIDMSVGDVRKSLNSVGGIHF